MIAVGVTREDLERALHETTQKYDGNVVWRREPEPLNKGGTRWRFTLTVKDSAGPGARIGHSGRRVKAACWHAHGDFFEALFKLKPNAVVKAVKRTVTKDRNWQDWNIGSAFRPLYFSEACECGIYGPPAEMP